MRPLFLRPLVSRSLVWRALVLRPQVWRPLVWRPLLALQSLLIIALLLPVPVAAQPAPAIEEIVISEIRSPRLWRLHIERAEDNVYDILNGLLDDPALRVRCRREPSTRSFIPVRTCEPQFLTRHRVSSTRNVIVDWRSDDEDQVRGLENAVNNRLATESELKADLADQYEAMNRKILELAQDNPQLMQALEQLAELQSAFADSVADQ